MLLTESRLRKIIAEEFKLMMKEVDKSLGLKGMGSGGETSNHIKSPDEYKKAKDLNQAYYAVKQNVANFTDEESMLQFLNGMYEKFSGYKPSHVYAKIADAVMGSGTPEARKMFQNIKKQLPGNY